MLLKKGSKSESVKTMQKLLLLIGYKIDCDGIFGSDTEKIVRQFQTDYNLVSDGLFGNISYNTLIAISKKQTQNFSEKIIWLSPLQLKSAIVNKKSSSLVKSFKNFVNANFFYNGKCIGWLISEGNILSRRDEYKIWKGLTKGTFIVLKNGEVKVGQMSDKEIADIAGQIWFACQGYIDPKPEGFNPNDVGRKCLRPILMYNEKTNKVGICVFKGDYLLADLVAKKYGCNKYINLDAGGSTNFFVNGIGLFVTSRELIPIIHW